MRHFVKVAALLLGLAALPAVAGELDQLEGTVQAAEAVRDVKRLQLAFGHYLEAGRWDDAAALFTAQATATYPEDEAKGRAAIRRQLMQRAGRAGAGLAVGQLHALMPLQPIVTMDAGGATVRATWHEFAMEGRHGVSAEWHGGVYENEYQREGGRWKISRLRHYPQYRGDFDDFGHRAPARWNIPYHFEAAHVGVTIPQALRLRSLSTAGAGSDEARRAALAARVVRLQDETDIQNLQHAFGYYLDRKHWDDVVDLFTPTGSMRLGDDAVRGAAAIRAELERRFGAPSLQRGELFDHVLLGTVVTVDAKGQQARARSTQITMQGRVGQQAGWELGTYENEYVKEAGVWKLRLVRYQPRMITDYDLGWARDWRPRASMPGLPVHFRNPAKSVPAPAPVAHNTGTLSVQSIQAAIERVIAVDAVENLNSHYGYTIDESAWDHMADMYAGSGSKEITGVGVYVGPDRIRRILNLRGPRGGRTADFFTIHQLTQPVIHVAADGRSAKARLRLFQNGGSADGSSGSWIGGIYENTAIFENGEWKFGVQDLHHLYNASYRNGWARLGGVTRLASQGDNPSNGRDVAGGGIRQGLGGASSPGSFAKDFPPDGPIRAKQYAFPEIVEPAFHYRNPVSGRMPVELLP